ncbi:MAG: DUF554 domain-containing protein [Dethiobacter sp.]|jgi:uncharacterized membrane protein YqgA involved in biofilm formation|nr:DUF554 domain-containing protein [Dethiobacter sp.]MBS3897342.1 DUF554 domain-containing protein [Dethiobacter sp.]MBS3983845.1 DUF554 domain-containing protein [Dethiobacter sp.]MCL4463605.1 DUF554 domain-containing protein [Bacillota bacterium]MCL5992905.1 DUF554 domain-containing protein [Bacillota bacterium]
MDISWSYALLGTAVNGAAIVTGGVLGALLGNRIPERIKQRVLQGIALSVLLIGIKMALETQNMLVVVFSLVIGGIVGELLGIDAWLRRVGDWLELRASQSGSGVAQSFVFATLLYGVGSMAVMGALESGLLGQHQILYVKAILDGTTSVALAASMGIGVSLSAVPVVLYQGSIALAAGSLQPFLGANVVGELSGVGGLLILAVGLNMLELQEIKVANFLPAFVVVLVWVGILPTLL